MWAGSLDVTKITPVNTSVMANIPTMIKFGADVVKTEPRKFADYFQTSEKPKGFVTLIFGDTASGKTFTSMSFPEPLYIIDTENRASSTKYYNYRHKQINIFEPVQFKTQFTETDIDSFDTYKTIEEINHFIIDFANEVKSGRISKGTLVVDSTTDIWSFVQDWSITELSKKLNSKGEKRADPLLMKMQNQFDWGVPNKKHAEMLGILRSLIKYGIYIVFTAREREAPPDYAQQLKVITMKEKIRAQKDVPFLSDVIINLKKTATTTGTKYMGQIAKFNGLPIPDPVENVTYDTLVRLMDEQEKKLQVKT